jgi:hypothetical protein
LDNNRLDLHASIIVPGYFDEIAGLYKALFGRGQNSAFRNKRTDRCFRAEDMAVHHRLSGRLASIGRLDKMLLSVVRWQGAL